MDDSVTKICPVDPEISASQNCLRIKGIDRLNCKHFMLDYFSVPIKVLIQCY